MTSYPRPHWPKSIYYVLESRGRVFTPALLHPDAHVPASGSPTTCFPSLPNKNTFLTSQHHPPSTMTSKMKRCIAKLRGRTNTIEKHPQQHPSSEALMSPNSILDGGATAPYPGDSILEEPDPELELKRMPTVEQKALDELVYWGPTKRIPEEQLVALLERAVVGYSYSYKPHWKLINRLNGAFNVAYILESAPGLKVCVRVPAAGFPARWNQ